MTVDRVIDAETIDTITQDEGPSGAERLATALVEAVERTKAAA